MWFILNGYREYQEILSQERCNAVIMEIQKPSPLAGLAFPEEEAEKILARIGLTGTPKKIPTDLDGLVLLKFSTGRTEDLSVNIRAWRGDRDNQRRFQNAAAQLLPVVKKDIEIEALGGKRTEPVDDDLFHIYLWASAAAEEATVIETPPSIFGNEVERGENFRSFSPTGKIEDSILIFDEETGYAVAQIVGNNLFIHHDITRYGIGRESEIFNEIITRAIKWLRLSPKERSARKQAIKEDLAQGRVIIGIWREGSQAQKRFAKATRELLLPVIKKDIVLHAPGQTKEKLINDGRFHIFFNSSVSKNRRQMVRPPDEIFGIPVDCRNEAFQACGNEEESVVITDDEGDYAIAELFESNLFVHHHITCKGNEREEKIFRCVLEAVIEMLTVKPEERARIKEQKRLEKQQREAAEEETERQRLTEFLPNARKRYIQACGKRFPEIIKKAVQTIDQESKRLEKLGGQLISTANDIRLAESSLELMTARIEKNRQACAEDFNKILALPGVLGARLEDRTFSVFTDIIRIIFDGKERLIGQFRIDINASAECCSIRFFNLTNWGRGPGFHPPEGFDADAQFNRHHPCVDGEGRAEMGKLETEIIKFLGKNQYAATVKLLLQFLRVVNPTGYAGRGLKWWPEEGAETADALLPALPMKRIRPARNNELTF